MIDDINKGAKKSAAFNDIYKELFSAGAGDSDQHPLTQFVIRTAEDLLWDDTETRRNSIYVIYNSLLTQDHERGTLSLDEFSNLVEGYITHLNSQQTSQDAMEFEEEMHGASASFASGSSPRFVSDPTQDTGLRRRVGGSAAASNRQGAAGGSADASTFMSSNVEGITSQAVQDMENSGVYELTRGMNDLSLSELDDVFNRVFNMPELRNAILEASRNDGSREDRNVVQKFYIDMDRLIGIDPTMRTRDAALNFLLNEDFLFEILPYIYDGVIIGDQTLTEYQQRTAIFTEFLQDLMTGHIVGQNRQRKKQLANAKPSEVEALVKQFENEKLRLQEWSKVVMEKLYEEAERLTSPSNSPTNLESGAITSEENQSTSGPPAVRRNPGVREPRPLNAASRRRLGFACPPPYDGPAGGTDSDVQVAAAAGVASPRGGGDGAKTPEPESQNWQGLDGHSAFRSVHRSTGRGNDGPAGGAASNSQVAENSQPAFQVPAGADSDGQVAAAADSNREGAAAGSKAEQKREASPGASQQPERNVSQRATSHGINPVYNSDLAFALALLRGAFDQNPDSQGEAAGVASSSGGPVRAGSPLRQEPVVWQGLGGAAGGAASNSQAAAGVASSSGGPVRAGSPLRQEPLVWQGLGGAAGGAASNSQAAAGVASSSGGPVRAGSPLNQGLNVRPRLGETAGGVAGNVPTSPRVNGSLGNLHHASQLAARAAENRLASPGVGDVGTGAPQQTERNVRQRLGGDASGFSTVARSRTPEPTPPRNVRQRLGGAARGVAGNMSTATSVGRDSLYNGSPENHSPRDQGLASGVLPMTPPRPFSLARKSGTPLSPNILQGRGNGEDRTGSSFSSPGL